MRVWFVPRTAVDYRGKIFIQSNVGVEEVGLSASGTKEWEEEDRQSAQEPPTDSANTRRPSAVVYPHAVLGSAAGILWFLTHRSLDENMKDYRRSLISQKGRGYWEDARRAKTFRDVAAGLLMGEAVFGGFKAFKWWRNKGGSAQRALGHSGRPLGVVWQLREDVFVARVVKEL